MRGATRLFLATAVTGPVLVWGSVQQSDALVNANPIRKVVTMLQMMQKKVEAEGVREQELFDKFMCYCKNSGGGLQKSISDAETREPQLGSDIEEGEAAAVQLKEDLKTAQVDRSAAKAAMDEATGLRSKEATAFAKESGELKLNIAALSKAVTAIDNGMAGGFLQTDAAQVLKRAVLSADIMDADRQDVMEFLSGGQDSSYSPQSGSISGILKTMGDEMSKSLVASTTAEDQALASYDELMAAKKKEVDALSHEIEVKLVRTGELAVHIVQMKNDLTDTQQALLEDKKFLADMEKDCDSKAGEWAAIVKTRQEELLALADTIKILNDDDALEMFKKTLPSASASFVQVRVNMESARTRAMLEITRAQDVAFTAEPQLDFIALAIRGQKAGFGKVIKLIDEMVVTLKKEQVDDDHKEEYCAKQFDMSDDKKKGLEKVVSDLETAIIEAKDGIVSLKAELEALEDGVKALDKSVAEATEQRKDEHEDFTESMSSNAAAKELLGFAKNRLNKFYNPKLYKPPAAALLQIVSHHQAKDAPPPAPEAPGAFEKKGEDSNNVISMIDVLIRDLDKEMTESETEEKDAQGDYEDMMRDSKEKRASDSKSLTEKQSTKAELETSLESNVEDKKSSGKELMATEEYIAALHAECDWLLKYFDMRKQARAEEVDALEKAKAVLSGADFSLLQTKSGNFLQRG